MKAFWDVWDRVSTNRTSAFCTHYFYYPDKSPNNRQSWRLAAQEHHCWQKAGFGNGTSRFKTQLDRLGDIRMVSRALGVLQCHDCWQILFGLARDGAGCLDELFPSSIFWCKPIAKWFSIKLIFVKLVLKCKQLRRAAYRHPSKPRLTSKTKIHVCSIIPRILIVHMLLSYHLPTRFFLVLHSFEQWDWWQHAIIGKI